MMNLRCISFASVLILSACISTPDPSEQNNDLKAASASSNSERDSKGMKTANSAEMQSAEHANKNNFLQNSDEGIDQGAVDNGLVFEMDPYTDLAVDFNDTTSENAISLEDMFFLELPDVYNAAGVDDEDKIWSGRQASAGQFPWAASIHDGSGTASNSFRCSGTIIGPQVILTAGHCFFTKVDLGNGASRWIRVPDGNINVRIGGLAMEGRQPISARVVPNPSFNPNISSANDSALLFLGNRIQFSTNTYPAQLPPQSQQPPEYHPLNVSGFGKTNFSSGSSYALMWARQKFLTRKTCNGVQYYRGEVPYSQFCAGETANGAHTCKGDSGGGLVTRTSPHSILVGVTSLRKKICGDPSLPSVYTDVSSILPWIHRETRSRQVVLGGG